MGLFCDLCRKPLIQGKNKWIKGVRGRDICLDCISVCVEIIKDPDTKALTYLNEWRDKKEMEKEIKR